MSIKAKELRINPTELRIGNLVTSETWKGIHMVEGIVSGESGYIITVKGYEHIVSTGIFCEIIPIVLTVEILLKAGFEKINHFTVTNSMTIHVGRDRYLSIGCVGTPNEILWLSTQDEGIKKIDDLICLHNFDYDGKLYLHTVQNWYKLFTNTELKIEKI